jgi:two-component system, OmpR family, sensor histidine kinase KdpD
MGFELAETRAYALMIGAPALLVAATTPALLALNSQLPPNLIWLGYLIPVVLASVRWGFAGAAAAAVIAGLAGDYFFTQPYYSLWMEDSRDVAALLLFLLAAFGSALVITAGARSNDSELKSTSAVHQLLRELARCQTSRDVVTRFDRWISVAASGRAIFIGARSDDRQAALIPGDIRRIAVEMCAAQSDGVRTIATAANKRWLLRQLRSEHDIHGTLAVEIASGCNDRRIAEAALTAAAMRFSDLARRETLSAAAGYFSDAEFSNRWGSQLTTIVGAASVLQMRAQADAARVEHTLLADIRDEAVHLGRLLKNAFSALRATVHGAQPRLDWVDPADLIAATFDRATPSGAAVTIETTIENDLPLVAIDPALFAEGCEQLLSDALRLSPPKSTIQVDVHRAGTDVAVAIGRAPCRDAAGGDGEPRLQHPSGSSEFEMWIAASLVRAAGAIINPVSPPTPYGPIATLRIPIRRAHQARPA